MASDAASQLATTPEEAGMMASDETARDRSRSPPRGARSVEIATPAPPAAPVIPSYSALEPEKWVAKQVGKNALGAPTICIYDNATRTAPIFALYEGEECGTLVFPLEPHKDAQRPAFMTGGEPTRKVESLDLITTLEGEQVKAVKAIDDWCKKQALENSKDWFGRTCSPTEIDVMYSSPIKIDESGKYAPNLRAKMNLAGIDKFLTQVTVVRANGVPEEGAGWEFVEPRLGEQKWRQHKARMVLEARRIWIVNKRFGLTYSITDLAVREKAETRPNPFAYDNSVEALSAAPAC